ncbi:hypothetical protein AY599_26625 [Leptolyngbya valderiana BDU 20041]|nr:hypothetical protein AY599_26625 [Leptolyngbya valderiana BDU 20041]
MRLTFLLVALASLTTAMSEFEARAEPSQPPPLPAAWVSPLLQKHPLVGRIWEPATGAFVTAEQVATRLAAADVVLLGEKHDNPDHHRLQAWAVSAMAAAGRRPEVAFEMIPRDRAAALAAYLEAGGDAAGLGAAVGWAEGGWPDWSLYRPIAEAALAAGLPLGASDLPRAKRRQVAEEGAAALPESMRTLWALDRPWTAEMRDGLLQELSAAHCDVAPPQAFAGMAEVQRARDAAMADALLAALGRPTDGAVLIAGKGHTRPDRGVPWFLRQRAPDLAHLAIAYVEVREGVTQAAAYGDLGDHDLVWFTPRLDDVDPCERFAEQLERLKPAE